MPAFRSAVLLGVAGLSCVAAQGDGQVMLDKYLLTSYSEAKTLTGKVASYYFKMNPNPPAEPIWLLMFEQCTPWDISARTYDDHCNTANGVYCDGATEDQVSMSEGSGLNYWMYSEKGAHVIKTVCEYGDSYMGDAEYEGYYFKGASVVKAILQAAIATHGMGSGKPEMLVVYGGSSGAIAATHHLDKVESYISSVKNVHIVGILDSGVPLKPCLNSGSEAACEKLLSVNTDYEQEYTSPFNTIVNHYGPDFSGDSCQYKAPSKGDCIYGEYHLPYMRKPFLLFSNKNDAGLGLTVYGHYITVTANKCSASDSSCESLANLGDYTGKAFDNLDIKRANNAEFVANCFAHGLSNTASFTKASVGGVTMQDAADFYLFRGNGKSWSKGPAVSTATLEFKSWTESCTSFSCGTGCPSDCGGVCGANGKLGSNITAVKNAVKKTGRARSLDGSGTGSGKGGGVGKGSVQPSSLL